MARCHSSDDAFGPFLSFRSSRGKPLQRVRRLRNPLRPLPSSGLRRELANKTQKTVRGLDSYGFEKAPPWLKNMIPGKQYPEATRSAITQQASTLSPFRYPGGKSRLRSKIINWLGNLGYRPQHFIEPFAGGASVGLAIAELDLADHVTLVERDPDVAAVWNVVLNGSADALAIRIREFLLTHESARQTLDGNERDLV